MDAIIKIGCKYEKFIFDPHKPEPGYELYSAHQHQKIWRDRAMSVKQTLLPNKNLDENWVNLMIVARDSGLSTEEVRQFLRECKENDDEPKH
jgi:hypothetical protein